MVGAMGKKCDLCMPEHRVTPVTTTTMASLHHTQHIENLGVYLQLGNSLETFNLDNYCNRVIGQIGGSSLIRQQGPPSL